MSGSEVEDISTPELEEHLVIPMSSQRLSNKEFQVLLHALFENDPLKIKYQNPDAWRRY